MNHLPPMIVDLAVILAAAAASTLLFRWLRQPLVLGYLIAGFAVGPHFKFFPTVVDTEGVKLWAEIGVVFLLFGLGLEFSFKKLGKVGKSAFIAAFFEIITMIILGYLLGRALGWTLTDSIYLGAALSVSSTTIIVRAFDEAGLKGKVFVNLVFGILIVEDLIAILLMVALAAFSESGGLSPSNMVVLSARLGFFLLIWFLIGIYILPSGLNKIRRFLNDEIMLIVSISLCFLMVVLATKTGFSAALGAFVMGSILAETTEGERIEHLLAPVKNLFAAVFFVSVGMMINPQVLQEHFWVIVTITLVTIFGKLAGSGFGAVLSGRGLKQSFQSGMSLAQIGEFSFIIVVLGQSLKVTSDFLYPIIVAVSAVTTFTTPYMIKYSGSMYSWVEHRLPERFIKRLKQYEDAMASVGKEGALRLLWRVYGLAAMLNSVVVIGIGLVASQILLPALVQAFGDGSAVRLSVCILSLVVSSPFLLAIAFKVPKKLASEEAVNIVRLRKLQFGISFMRLLLGLILIEIMISQFFTAELLSLIVWLSVPIAFFAFRGAIERFYMKVEDHFLKNLNANDLIEVEKLTNLPQLVPWNASLIQITLSSDSKVVGQTLEESKFRTKTGATVVMIDRGTKRIFAPDRSVRLLPGDEIFLIGTEEQLGTVHELVMPEPTQKTLAHDEIYNLESFLIDKGSRFAGKIIRDIGLGEEFGGLIVGIERESERILNPESTVSLKSGDLIWVFGRKDKIRALKQYSS